MSRFVSVKEAKMVLCFASLFFFPSFLLTILFLSGIFTYTVTSRYPSKNNQRVETRRDIGYREYQDLLSQKDPLVESIIKTRRCFVYENQSYQIDYYHHPRAGLSLLEAYMPSQDQKGILPKFLTVLKEVTDDPDYSMFNLAKKVGRDRKSD